MSNANARVGFWVRGFLGAMVGLLLAAPLESMSVQADEGGSFVPRECIVEDWCLVKATECFLGRVERPQGLYQAYTQYSVVRRVTALCAEGYSGERVRRVLTGPVEPVVFRSAVESTSEKASGIALDLCHTYRRDWLAAAPACGPR